MDHDEAEQDILALADHNRSPSCWWTCCVGTAITCPLHGVGGGPYGPLLRKRSEKFQCKISIFECVENGVLSEYQFLYPLEGVILVFRDMTIRKASTNR